MAPEIVGSGKSAIENGGAVAIAVFGLVLGTVGIEYVVTHPEPLAWWSIEFAIAVLFPAGLMGAGYWLARTDFDADELWELTAWSFAGVVGLTTAGGWTIIHQTTENGTVAEPVFLLITQATIGALSGLALGVAKAGSLGGGSAAARVDAETAKPSVPDDASEATGSRRRSGGPDGTSDHRPPAPDGTETTDETTGRADSRDRSEPSGGWIGLASVPASERDVEEPDFESLIGGEQRRWTIAYLASAPGRSMTIHQIVDTIVERRLKTAGRRPDREQVLRRLHCIDLPKLAAAGLIERDDRVIRYVGDSETTRRLLTLVDAIESNADD